MTRTRMVLAIIALVGVLTVVATTLIGLSIEQTARDQQAVASVAGCLRQSARNAVIINVWRAQQASNEVRAEARQLPSLRRAGAREAAALTAGILAEDQSTDRSVAIRLVDRADQIAVERNGFSCAAEFKPAGFLP